MHALASYRYLYAFGKADVQYNEHRLPLATLFSHAGCETPRYLLPR